MLNRLPERFVIIIEGTRLPVIQRSNIVPNALPHLIDQLLTGSQCQTVVEALKPFGLRVTIEENTDQGDEA